MIYVEHLRELLGLAQNDFHLFIGKWLEQIIERALGHALHGEIHRAFGAHHHHHRLGRAEVDLFQKLRALAVGQRLVEQHEVEIAFAHKVVGFLDGTAFGDVDAFFAQVLRDLFAEEFLLGDHDDFLDGHGFLARVGLCTSAR